MRRLPGVFSGALTKKDSMTYLRYTTLIALAALAVFTASQTFAQITTEDVGTDKLAQTNFKFLKVSVHPRSAGQSDAITASEFNSSAAMFYNPAAMGWMESRFSAGFGITNWIADITYNTASAAIRTNYGVFGASLLFADYGGGIIGTIVAPNERGYQEYSELGVSNPDPSAMAIGLGYGVAVTDRFGVGGNAKYVLQDLTDAVLSSDGTTEANSASTVAFDFGLLYKTGFRSLNLAMTVRNFSRELRYVQENFELPLTFNVGVSMNMLDLTAMDPNVHALRVSLEAERPRDFAEQLKAGGEYTFMNIVSLRAGYTYPTDVQGVSLGGGLKYDTSAIGFSADYAYTAFDIFGAVHRMGVSLSF